MARTNPTRRRVIRTIAYAGAATPLMLPSLVRAVAPSSKLNLASVGCAGKGWEDLLSSSGNGKRHHVVALCDIDHRKGGRQPRNLSGGQAARPLGLGAAAERFPDAQRFFDFRKMFDKVADIDAVTVSTPDHMHATVALTAMSLGKHVYVQKPLTQTVHEARVMQRIARQQKVVTQMGNQAHTSIGYRCLVDVIREGAIGKVREAHAWTPSPSWPQGIGRPQGADPVPDKVDWDLWIGVGKPRPYKTHAYHNFNWRGWQEFGTGALGDMGCHIMDPVVWALDLARPTHITADCTEINRETYPRASTVTYRFAPTAHTADQPITVKWYDGGRMPPIDLARGPAGYRYPKNGSMFIGEKGVLITSHFPSAPRLHPVADFQEYSRTRLREIYKSYPALDHYNNWTDAIVNGVQADSNFEVAAPLAQTVLLGTIAQRLPGRSLEWDDRKARFADSPEADRMVQREYRKGWAIDLLR